MQHVRKTEPFQWDYYSRQENIRPFLLTMFFFDAKNAHCPVEKLPFVSKIAILRACWKRMKKYVIFWKENCGKKCTCSFASRGGGIVILIDITLIWICWIYAALGRLYLFWGKSYIFEKNTWYFARVNGKVHVHAAISMVLRCTSISIKYMVFIANLYAFKIVLYLLTLMYLLLCIQYGQPNSQGDS